MSSMGASYAAVYVQQKRQKERLAKKKKMEEEEEVGEILRKSKPVVIKADKICSAKTKTKIHPAPLLI